MYVYIRCIILQTFYTQTHLYVCTYVCDTCTYIYCSFSRELFTFFASDRHRLFETEYALKVHYKHTHRNTVINTNILLLLFIYLIYVYLQLGFIDFCRRNANAFVFAAQIDLYCLTCSAHEAEITNIKPPCCTCVCGCVLSSVTVSLDTVKRLDHKAQRLGNYTCFPLKIQTDNS